MHRQVNEALVEWEKLSATDKDLDRNTVRVLPDILAQVGLRIVREPPHEQQAGTQEGADRGE